MASCIVAASPLPVQAIRGAVNLKLRDSGLRPPGALVVAAMLKYETVRSLTCVDVSHNAIGTTGAAAIGDALASYDSLKILNVANNNLGPDGAKALAGVLPKCK